MSNTTRKMEALVNVAIIVVALAVCAALTKQYLLPNSQARTHGPAVGSDVELAGVDLTGEDRTLLLVLQKGCHFCAESGPFYQRLAREAEARGGRVKLLAVLPQEAEEGRRYLEELGVHVERVAQASPGSLDVTGTPTLIMLERGKVSDVWVGKLDEEREREVLGKL